MDNPLEGYKEEENLQEILERLSLYCIESGVKDPQITLLLPKQAMDRFNLSLRAKARIEELPPSKLKSIHLQSGIVELKSADEYQLIPSRP